MNDYVYALTTLPNGELIAGGIFYTAGGSVSFARYSFTGIPTMSVQPEPQSVDSGQTVTISATPSNGYSNVSVQWRRNGVAISNGAGGASSGGGTVSGASGPLPSPTDATPAVLTITGVQASDAGDYTAVFSNSCGGVTSESAVVAVNGGCAADFNHDGFVNGDDYDFFAEAFDVADPAADFNHDGFVNGDDYDAFAEHFDVGC